MQPQIGIKRILRGVVKRSDLRVHHLPPGFPRRINMGERMQLGGHLIGKLGPRLAHVVGELGVREPNIKNGVIGMNRGQASGKSRSHDNRVYCTNCDACQSRTRIATPQDFDYSDGNVSPQNS